MGAAACCPCCCEPSPTSAGEVLDSGRPPRAEEEVRANGSEPRSPATIVRGNSAAETDRGVPDRASFATLVPDKESFATLPRNGESFNTLVPDRASFRTLQSADSFSGYSRVSFHTEAPDRHSFQTLPASASFHDHGRGRQNSGEDFKPSLNSLAKPVSSSPAYTPQARGLAAPKVAPYPQGTSKGNARGLRR